MYFSEAIYRNFRRGFWMAALAASLLCGTVLPARAELLQYVDVEGDVHYVESIHHVPERYRPQVRKIDGGKVPAYTPKAAPVTGKARPEPLPLLTDRNGRTQAYWCLRRAELKKEIDTLSADVKELEGMGAVDLRQPSGPRVLNAIQNDLAAGREKLTAAEEKLAGLADEARKAGAPAGWLKGSRCPTDGPIELGAGNGAGDKVPTGQETPPTGSKEWWESRKASLEKKRASLEREIAEKEKLVTDLGEIYDPVVNAYNKRLGKGVESLRSELKSVEQELADLPRQAQEAGVPPGWVR